jgi:hypothetical protein
VGGFKKKLFFYMRVMVDAVSEGDDIPCHHAGVLSGVLQIE